ncbi:MAG: RIP metalloprotease RseP, partial [Succinivibrio dextrinosolvens]|nr:RIP metalloprotease RseP [Succinivibrio dextrinosolvens]
MVNFIGGIFYFLLALGILVTIHELGHFLAARACKVKVLRFSLGFGPVIYKKTGKDGCEYAVSAIPLGGYVKMEGENNPAQGDKLMPSNEGLSPDSFKAKPVWQRAIIIFAGPFFNIALAVILFTIVNMSGISERYAVVGDVAPMSIAQEAGFKTFDRIEAVEGKSIETWSDFVYTLVEYTGSNKILDVVV